MKIRIILVLLLCALISSCYIQSLSRFYTEDLVVDFPEIQGEWISKMQLGEEIQGDTILPWKFMEDAIASYDENNKYSELDVVYFKIDEVYYLDFTAGSVSKTDEELGNPYWGVGITLTHSLCMVLPDGDKLVILPLNFDWFKDKIDKNELSLAYIKADDESNYIFTATSSEWVSFLKEHADDESIFSEKLKFIFQRKK